MNYQKRLARHKLGSEESDYNGIGNAAKLIVRAKPVNTLANHKTDLTGQKSPPHFNSMQRANNCLFKPLWAGDL